jgi:phage tail sheath protein FI
LRARNRWPEWGNLDEGSMIAAPPPIRGVPTSITLFIGWTARGPDDRATRIASFAEYEQIFGGLDARTPLGHSVQHFFDNGGSDAYVVRLTGETNVSGGGEESVLAPGSDGFQAALLSGEVFGPGSITDTIDLFNLVCVPGESDPSTLAALQSHCGKPRAFLLIDPDSSASIASLREGLPAELMSDDAANAAMFFPWVRAPDPLQAGAGADFPPCGFVAGILARNDRDRGVWKVAAGVEALLADAIGPSIALNDAELGELNSVGISCIRALPAGGTVVWGARTLLGQDASQSPWKFIPARRLALFIEGSIARGTLWAANEVNDEALWAKLRASVEDFMLGLFADGAFQGTRPAEAFFVRCDSTTTTQADIDNGVVNIVVGFAPFRPGEFVVLNLQQPAGNSPH